MSHQAPTPGLQTAIESLEAAQRAYDRAGEELEQLMSDPLIVSAQKTFDAVVAHMKDVRESVLGELQAAYIKSYQSPSAQVSIRRNSRKAIVDFQALLQALVEKNLYIECLRLDEKAALSMGLIHSLPGVEETFVESLVVKPIVTTVDTPTEETPF